MLAPNRVRHDAVERDAASPSASNRPKAFVQPEGASIFNESVGAPPWRVGQGVAQVVFNAGSGHGEGDSALDAIRTGLVRAGQPHRIWELPQPGLVITEGAAQAVAAARASGGIVVAAGGDGTLNAVAQHAWEAGIAMAAVPRGTYNYFGRRHGLPTEPADAVEAFLKASAQAVQVGEVNGKLFLVNANIGLYPQLLEDREAWKARFGRSRFVAAVAAFASFLKGHRSWRIDLAADEGPARQLAAQTVFIGNNALQFEAMGMPDAHRVGAGLLGVATLKPVTTWGMLGLMLRGALGTLADAERLELTTAHEVAICRKGLRATRPIKVATDGEVQWLSGPLHFQVATKPLWLLRAPLGADASGTPAGAEASR